MVFPMCLNKVMPLKVFETKKDLDEQHAGTNEKNSFLKNAETDLLVGHTDATGAPTATLKAYLEYDNIFCSAFSFQRHLLKDFYIFDLWSLKSLLLTGKVPEALSCEACELL